MSQLPPAELLEATHQFPCRYTFKAIGHNSDDFEKRAVHAVREVLELAGELEATSRHTENGQHVAVTIVLDVDTAEQVLQVYSRLHRLEGLKLLL
ncbi:MAG: YbeD family protein [Planctomycetaceae bacterium]